MAKKTEFAHELQRQRNRLGLSRSWCAEQLGVSLWTLRAWERGRRNIPFLRLLQLFELLEVPHEERLRIRRMQPGVVPAVPLPVSEARLKELTDQLLTADEQVT
jgi:DNA-binding XRE family transcriptional regulator